MNRKRKQPAQRAIVELVPADHTHTFTPMSAGSPECSQCDRPAGDRIHATPEQMRAAAHAAFDDHQRDMASNPQYANTAIVESLRCELQAMVPLGMITLGMCERAVAYVAAHPDEFSPDTGMSVTESADMAIECAKAARQVMLAQARQLMDAGAEMRSALKQAARDGGLEYGSAALTSFVIWGEKGGGAE